MNQKVTVVVEGATYQGSVALLRGSTVIAESSLDTNDDGNVRGGRGERLMPAIAGCMSRAEITGADVGAILCGAGPGSFTSLRVAASVAKGLAVAYDVQLYAVSSLLLTVAGARMAIEAGKYLSLLDAMRGEYFALPIEVDESAGVVPVGAVRIIGATDLANLRANESDLRFIGPGQDLDTNPHARGAARLVDDILRQGPVPLNSWEPDYGRLAEAQVRWEAAHGRPLA